MTLPTNTAGSTTNASLVSRLVSVLSTRRVFWVALLVITIYASALRLVGLDRYPVTFNQDEMTLGYDAWSLWRTARDQHGQLLPVHFKTFGDYVPPTAYYLTAPFVGLLGLSEFSTRLPFALTGIATIVLVALLGRRWFGPMAGLLAALFLSVSTWHINYSRIAFPTSVLPFFTVCTLYAYTRGLDMLAAGGLFPETPGTRWHWQRAGWLAASGVCFALLTAAYSTMKVDGPLLFGACLLAAAPLLWRHRGLALVWIGAYLLCVSPLLIDQLTRWDIVGARFRQVGVFGNPDWPLEALRLYSEHFNLSALAFTAFRGGVGIYVPDIGSLFWLDVPLCIAAVVALSRWPRARRVAFSLPLLLGLWLITYPVADALTNGDSVQPHVVGHPHELRAYNLLPLPELLAGCGAAFVASALLRQRRNRVVTGLIGAAGVLGTIGLFAFFNACFLPFYFGGSIDPATAPYNYGLRAALDRVRQVAEPCDVLWLDDTTRAYIYYLFLAQYPPERFQPVAAITGLGFTSFGQLHIGTPDADQPAPTPQRECAGQPYRAFYATRGSFAAPGWQPITPASETPAGSPWHVLATTSRLPWPTLPNDATPIHVTLGEHIMLEGYQLKREGRVLTLTLYWRTYQQLPEDDHLFVHVLAGDTLVAQQDGNPTPPIHAWVPGQVIPTVHSLNLPEGAPEPDTITVGLYRYPSLERLSVVVDGKPREDGQVILWSKALGK